MSWTAEFTYENQDKYVGALINRNGKMVRQGQGTYTHKCIDDTVEVYQGDFRDNRRNGFGVYTYANGDTEQGQWVDGLPHGEHEFFSRAEDDNSPMLGTRSLRHYHRGQLSSPRKLFRFRNYC